MTEPVDVLELARECARRVIENEILAIHQGDVLNHVWDLCPGAYRVIEGDVELRDQLWEAICQELRDAQVTYLLKDETARGGELRRVSLELKNAHLRLVEAQWHYDEFSVRYVNLGGTGDQA